MSINIDNYHSIIEELKEKATLVAVSKTKPNEDIMALYNLGQRDFGENYVQELVDKYEALPKDIRWHFIGHLQSNKVKYIAPFVHLIHGVDSLNLLKEINKQGIKNHRIIDCLLQVHIAKEETKFGFSEEEIVNMKMGKYENLQIGKWENVQIKGLMGMASFSEDMNLVRKEFRGLKRLFDCLGMTDDGQQTTDDGQQTKDDGRQTMEGAKHHSEQSESKTFNFQPSTFNLQPSTFNLQPSTFNFQPSTLSMGMSADYKIAIEEGSNMVRIGSLLFGERNYQKK